MSKRLNLVGLGTDDRFGFVCLILIDLFWLKEKDMLYLCSHL